MLAEGKAYSLSVLLLLLVELSVCSRLCGCEIEAAHEWSSAAVVADKFVPAGEPLGSYSVRFDLSVPGLSETQKQILDQSSRRKPAKM